MRPHYGACLVALLLVASSADAQSHRRLSSSGRTLADMIRSVPKPDGGMRRKVISLDSTSDNFIFAAAGSVQGAGGTFFRSDVTITNHRSVAQRIGISFMAQGVDNSNAPILEDTLPASTPVVYRDFVGVALGETGLGSVIVFGVKANGDLDPDAVLDGFSRIWTPQPGSAGSVSQGFPSVAFQDSLGSIAAYAQGLRHDTSFRTNAGIVNLDTATHTWTVDANGTSGHRTSFTVTVPPLSMKQQVVPNGNYSDLILGFSTNDAGFWWSAYGAAVDNVSGDSWSSHASQPGFGP
jgi:hypothetical protein